MWDEGREDHKWDESGPWNAQVGWNHLVEKYFSRLELIQNLTDKQGELTGGAVARVSGASYVDKNGILQIADGDGTPFSHSSIEDETSYTSMRFGPTWFNGEILGSNLCLNGTFDDSSWWDTINGAVTIAGGVAAINYSGAGDNMLKEVAVSGLSAGKLVKYSVECTAYTSGSLGFRITNNQLESIASATTFSGYYQIASDETDFRLAFTTADFVGSVDNITLQVVTSLSTQSFDNNLLIVGDGAGTEKFAYGYIGAAGTGEAKTVLSNNVTAITKANPGVVSSTAHGLVVGDLVYFSGLNEMTELNDTYKTVTVLDSANTFSINDTSGYGAAETTGGACASEITEPHQSAIKIYKEYSLTTLGWNAIDSGINYNAGANWNLNVYENLMSAPGSTAQARFETLGLLSEGEGTNWCLYSDDLTNAAWVKTNCTPLKDVTGINGTTNSASRLTATADNATCLQTLGTMASATHVFSVWMKRITGTGAVSLTDDNGGNWTEKTLTTSWMRFDVTRSQTGPVIGFKLAVDTDVIGVQFAQFEQSQAYRTSAIPTTTIPVTRTTDSYTWTMSTAFKNLMGNVADSPFTMVVEFTPKFGYGDSGASALDLINISTTKQLLRCDYNGLLYAYDGTGYSTVDSNYSANTNYIYALRVYDDSGTMKFVVGEKHGGSWTWDASPANYDGSFNPSTQLIIGYNNEYPFNIKNIRFWNEAKTQQWIENHA